MNTTLFSAGLLDEPLVGWDAVDTFKHDSENTEFVLYLKKQISDTWDKHIELADCIEDCTDTTERTRLIAECEILLSIGMELEAKLRAYREKVREIIRETI